MLTGELMIFFCQFTARTEFICEDSKTFTGAVPLDKLKREIFGIKNLYKGRLSSKKSLQASKRSFLNLARLHPDLDLDLDLDLNPNPLTTLNQEDQIRIRIVAKNAPYISSF